MVNHDLTRRAALRVTAVASLVAAQAVAGGTAATANERSVSDSAVEPRIELLETTGVTLRSGTRSATIPQVLGARIVVGTEGISSGTRLRFSGPTDAYDVADTAILGGAATGVVSDLPVKIVGASGEVVVTVSEALAPGGEYTVAVGTAVGERYPHPAPGQFRSGTVLLETAAGVVLASTVLTGEAAAGTEVPWAVSLAYTADGTGEPAAPTGWVTVYSVGPGSAPKGGEVTVLLDRSDGRPGLALGRPGASRPDTSRSVDAALTRRSGGAATYKVRLHDAIPAGKSIVIPLNAPDDGASIRAIEYRAVARTGSQRTTRTESIEVLLPTSG